MINPLISRLETVTPLSDSSRRAVEAICGDTRTIERGRDIVRDRNKPEKIFLLLEGWAASYKVLPGGSRQISAFLLPGDLCGVEITVLKRIDHSITALTPVTVSVVDSHALMRLTRERTELAHAFWHAALVDQGVLRSWVANLGRRDAYARVAYQACELHARLESRGLADGLAVDLPLTQAQLGDALGLTPVHVNRVLRRLRDDGLMELQGRTLTLLDPERLKAVTGFDARYLFPQQSFNGTDHSVRIAPPAQGQTYENSVLLKK